MTYRLGQHIRTLTDSIFPEDDYIAPAGTLGTITRRHLSPTGILTYDIVLSTDPEEMTVRRWPDDITPA